MSEAEVIKIARQMISAVAYLHIRKIVHRDIKPENILFDHQGNFKLCDFGFCAPFGDDNQRMTLCGTKEYLAPEVINCQEQTEKLDMWCLGVLLYELIHRKPPYSGKNVIQLINDIKNKNIGFRSTLNPELKEIIQACLHLEPEKRPSADFLLRTFPILKNEKEVQPFFNNLQNNLSNNYSQKTIGTSFPQKIVNSLNPNLPQTLTYYPDVYHPPTPSQKTTHFPSSDQPIIRKVFKYSVAHEQVTSQPKVRCPSSTPKYFEPQLIQNQPFPAKPKEKEIFENNSNQILSKEMFNNKPFEQNSLFKQINEKIEHQRTIDQQRTIVAKNIEQRKSIFETKYQQTSTIPVKTQNHKVVPEKAPYSQPQMGLRSQECKDLSLKNDLIQKAKMNVMSPQVSYLSRFQQFNPFKCQVPNIGPIQNTTTLIKQDAINQTDKVKPNIVNIYSKAADIVISSQKEHNIYDGGFKNQQAQFGNFHKSDDRPLQVVNYNKSDENKEKRIIRGQSSGVYSAQPKLQSSENAIFNQIYLQPSFKENKNAIPFQNSFIKISRSSETSVQTGNGKFDGCQKREDENEVRQKNYSNVSTSVQKRVDEHGRQYSHFPSKAMTSQEKIQNEGTHYRSMRTFFLKV